MANPNPTTEVFPQVDARLDVDGSTWNLNAITNESVALVATTAASSTAYKIGYLAERPAQLNFASSNAAPAISGFTLVTTVAAVNSATKFYVDYDRAFIIVASSVSSPVSVTYSGMGSVVRSREINNVHFGHNYLGPKSSAPSVDNEGNALVAGDQYYDTSTNKMYVRNGSNAWVDIAVSVGGNTITSTDGNNLTLTTVADGENVVINSTTGTSGNTILLPKVRATSNNFVLAMDNISTGSTAWQATSIPPVITGVSGELNTFENSAEDGGTLTLTGTDFGVNASDINSIKIMRSNGTSEVPATSFGTPQDTSIPNIVFDGSETGYNTFPADTTWYIEVTKSSLISNRFSSGKSFTKDPTISAITQSVASDDYNSAFTGTSGHFGSYGGQVAGGGDDSNTKLLLNFDRTGGTDIEDSSNVGGDGHKVTATNAVIKASPFGDGKSAMFFDGTDDYLTIPNHADFDFGAFSSGNANDFTIEFWANKSVVSGDRVFISRSHSDGAETNWYLRCDSAKLQLWTADTARIDIADVFTANVWTHVAMVRYGSTTTLYKDGNSVGSWTDTHNYTTNHANSTLKIGTRVTSSANAQFHSGYMDSIRIVKGTAVYTSNFTVPTSRFSESDQANTKLLIHSNQDHSAKSGITGQFIPLDIEGDGVYQRTEATARNSVAASNWDNSAWYFDGGSSGALFDSNGGADDNYADVCPTATSEMTIEFWMKTNSSSSTEMYLIDAGSTGWNLRYKPSTHAWVLFTNNFDSTGQQALGTHDVDDDAWHHIALVKYVDGSVKNRFKLYIDGVRKYTNGSDNDADSNATWPTNSAFRIGGDGGFYEGYLDDIRITKGLAVYSGDNTSSTNFTVPTGKLTTIWSGSSGIAGNSDASKVEFLLKASDSNSGTGGFVDSATTGTTHVITPTGSKHTINHRGIAPAMAWPTSGKTFGSSGVYFDGTGDYFDIPVNTDLNYTVASQAYSIDFWMYPVALNSNGSHIYSTGNDSNNRFLIIYYENNIQLYLKSGGAQEINLQTNAETNSPVPLYYWSHIAITRDTSGVNRMYINGKYQTKATNNTAYTTSTVHRFGARSYTDSGTYYNGYLDSIRFQKGVTLYSSSESTTNAYSVPTKIYGAYGLENPSIGSIEITTATDDDVNVAYSFQGSTEDNAAVLGSSSNLAIASDTTGANKKKGTLTGTLQGTAGSVTNLRIQAKANNDANRLVEVNETTGVGAVSFTKVDSGRPVLFNARRYVGNGLAREINEFGFKPDFIWLKNRDDSQAYMMYDSLRGTDAFLYSNLNNAQGSGAGERVSFTSDGIAPASGQTNNADTKANIGWGWKAGGSPSSSALSLSGGIGAGTLSNTGNLANISQSVNQNSGFCITKYTGTNATNSTDNLPHNLGAKPDWIIVKSLHNTANWVVWHKDLSTGKNLQLNTDSVMFDHDENGFIDGENTDTTTIRLSGGSGGNSSVAGTGTEGYICYAWKAVAGVSAFGTYTDNGSEPRTITTGFPPRLLFIKATDGVDHWMAYDAFREKAGTRNDTHQLRINDSASESTVSATTLGVTLKTDDGFILNGNHNAIHGDDNTYIYIAFA